MNLLFAVTKNESLEEQYVLNDYDAIPEDVKKNKITYGFSLQKFLYLFEGGQKLYQEFLSSTVGGESLQIQLLSGNTKYGVTIDRLTKRTVLIKMTEIDATQDSRESMSKESLFDMQQLLFQRSKEALALLKKTSEGFIYLYNNPEHQYLTGYQGRDILGKNIREILGENYYKFYEDKCVECIETGETILFKGTACWNGEVKDKMCRITPVRLGGEEYISVAELELEWFNHWMRENNLSVTRFDQMFQLNSAVMLLIEPTSGRIVDANPAAVKFYGYSIDELKKMKIQQINTLSSYMVEEQRGQVVLGKKNYFLFSHRLKNGETRLVDVHSSMIEMDAVPYLFSVITDATVRENNEIELFNEKELRRITMDSIADAVVATNEAGVITYINRMAMEVSGCGENAIGSKFDKAFPMINEKTLEVVSNIVTKVLDTRQNQELANHTMLITKRGELIPIEDSAALVTDKNGKIYGVVVVFRDVTLAREKKQKIEYLSYHDFLTGLYNRNFYYDYVIQNDVLNNYPLGYIIGDVNGLKMTNDVFGHEAGDLLLKSIAETISNGIKHEQYVMRWGGDEFLIIVPNTDVEHLESFVREVKERLKRIRINKVIEASVSFGMAIKTPKIEEADVVIKRAEELMYQKKLLESRSIRGNTVNALMASLDEKSAETKSHTIRLKEICMKIALEIMLDEEKKSRLSLLTVLHDIGKIGIPDHILEKPGDLTAEEWTIMKTHSEIGYRIASNVPELAGVADEILHHHERWDGSGYPSGLSGEEIPINCRILAIVDAYDAMTNDRVYRRGKAPELAMEELLFNSGNQFDPTLVRIFIDKVYQEELQRNS